MAAPKQKARFGFVVRFELGLLGMFTLTIVTGCLFFWMFIIGIWAGQTILQPNPGEEKSPLAKLAGALHSNNPATVEPVASPEQKKNNVSAAPEAAPSQSSDPAPEMEWAEAEPSFFALQVSALKDQDRAKQDVAQWKSRGYEAFSVPPEDNDDPFIRVYVGKFDKLADANQLLAKLEKEEKIKAYIALLPASRLQTP